MRDLSRRESSSDPDVSSSGAERGHGGSQEPVLSPRLQMLVHWAPSRPGTRLQDQPQPGYAAGVCRARPWLSASPATWKVWTRLSSPLTFPSAIGPLRDDHARRCPGCSRTGPITLHPCWVGGREPGDQNQLGPWRWWWDHRGPLSVRTLTRGAAQRPCKGRMGRTGCQERTFWVQTCRG